MGKFIIDSLTVYQEKMIKLNIHSAFIDCSIDGVENINEWTNLLDLKNVPKLYDDIDKYMNENIIEIKNTKVAEFIKQENFKRKDYRI